MLDPDHPFFARQSRRWATVIVCLLWFAVELWRGSMLWAAGVGAVSVWAAWALLLSPQARRRGN